MSESSSGRQLNKQIEDGRPRTRKRVGELLAEKGIITTLTVERTLHLCQKTGKRFGTILEELGLVTGEEIAQVLAIQYGYRMVSDFARHDFPSELLQMIPMETALQHTVFPLKVQNDALALAMQDPTNEAIVGNLRANGSPRICPFIATRKEINKAIARHYLNRDIAPPAETSILLVEDDKVVLSMLTNMLQREGYRVNTAADGMEAFREIISAPPNLIITDREMPKLDGYALLNSIRFIPETRTIPVILISESAKPEEEAMAYEKGFFDYIAKPVREVTLKAKVKRALTTHNPFPPLLRA